MDRTAPTFDPPQGSLWEQRAQPLTEKTYSTTIVARDGDASAPAAGRSGVKSIDFLVKRGDGSVAQTSVDPSPQGCMSNNCSKERAWELDTDSVEDGTYTIVAVATDQLGQQDSYTWTATVDRRPPVPTDVELESFDEARGSATIGWNTDDDPGLPNPATGSQVRYRLASGAWTAWQDAQSDLIQIMGIAADAIIDLEVRAVNAIGIVSAAVSQSVGAELSDLEQDFAEGDDSAGASAAITVELRGTDGVSIPVGGLPVTVTDTAGAHVTMLTTETGVVYFHGLSPGQYSVAAVQAGGVSAMTSDQFVVMADQRAEHLIRLEINHDSSQTTARATQVPSGVNDLFACIEDLDIPVKVCSQFVGDALRATFVTNVLFSTGSLGGYGGVPDDTRANAFRHSYAVARFTRTMLTKFKNDGPVTWAYRFARAHELQDRQSDDIRVRRSSFMDTNNNLVGYNYTTDHPTRNGAQLCSTMRTKSKHARYARVYPTGQDEIPVPPDAERTRLIYNLPYNPDVAGTGNPTDPGFFPQLKPCKYALARYDAEYEGG